MQRLSIIFYISLSLVGLTLLTLFAAHFLLFSPDANLIELGSGGANGSAGDAVGGWWTLVTHPTTRLVLFVACAGVAIYYVFLCRVIELVRPSHLVPDRVRTTLDSLTEGLVVVDRAGRIVMVNRAFATMLMVDGETLQGQELSRIVWREGELPVPAEQLPWRLSMRDGRIQSGYIIQWSDATGNQRTFRVNSSPMFDDVGDCHAVLASFDDITVLEERNAALTNMLTRLRKSRDQIHRQNQELQVLATRDPLTGAVNRRSFFELFEKEWNDARLHQRPLACLMVDVDHFKPINDTHGHAVGDDVLKGIVRLLQSGVRDGDVVARYGGEEFSIFMPETTLDQAHLCAERIRAAIGRAQIAGVEVTVSMGLSVNTLGASSPQELLNQSDQCLYAAKHGGRNCVRRWDQLDTVELPRIEHCRRPVRGQLPATHATISFQTVTALVTALAYRDVATAEHSRRVADLCVAVASRCMSLTECYLLENAALLHDIGNIGVPDAVLLKPGPLNDDEMKIITAHDRMSIDLISSTFGCPELTELVAHHHHRYDSYCDDPQVPVPLGARILAIADAYDAMVNDRVYRPAMSQAEAFEELRLCAGQQFDPEVVEDFIATVESLPLSEGTANLETVNKRTALLLGIQLENLAKALDQHDPATLAHLAGQLKQTAQRCGVREIAELAECLESSAAQDDTWIDNVRMTADLMELCRITQRSHLAIGMRKTTPHLAQDAYAGPYRSPV